MRTEVKKERIDLRGYTLCKIKKRRNVMNMNEKELRLKIYDKIKEVKTGRFALVKNCGQQYVIINGEEENLMEYTMRELFSLYKEIKEEVKDQLISDESLEIEISKYFAGEKKGDLENETNNKNLEGDYNVMKK